MSDPVTVAPTTHGRRLLRAAVDRSKRSNVPFPRSFLRDDTQAGAPPLARLLRGGRGGEVRLKLYMTLTMLAARAPHDIRGHPARVWAELLALPEPEINGARRIADALRWLKQADLVKLDQRRGLPPNVTLLSPSGNGKAYVARDDLYVNVPVGFWLHEWIYRLSGGAIALLLVLRDMRGKRLESEPPWLAGEQRGRYGLSDDTWTRGRKELERSGLLTVRRSPQGRDFDYRRLRNTYWVRMEDLSAP